MLTCMRAPENTEHLFVKKNLAFFKKTIDKPGHLCYTVYRKNEREEIKMITLNIKYANRTEKAVFETRWAAELKADEWMNRDPRIQAIEVLDNRVLVVTYRRKG